MLGIFFMLSLSSADFFFSKLIYFKNSIWNTIRMSNSLDPDQDRHSVCPDLGAYCLHKGNTQMAKDVTSTSKERVEVSRFLVSIDTHNLSAT